MKALALILAIVLYGIASEMEYQDLKRPQGVVLTP